MKNLAFLFAITMMIASCGANDSNNEPKTNKVETSTPIKVEQPKKQNVRQAQPTETTNESGIVWVTDVKTAFKLSKKTNKPVFAFFTGKKWCGWCKRLVAQVLSKPEFAQYANENFIMLELDFPRRDRSKVTPEMVQLQQQFNVKGYPTVLLLDHKKNVLGRTGYQNMTPAQYIQHLENFMK